MTRVINLYGGPGTGKSTSAAILYGMLKIAGENAELVREYVKDWAWEGRKPGPFDQLYFLGKGIRKETLLYGKVDWIVTDSPVMLGIYYARKYASDKVAKAVEETCKNFYADAKSHGVEHVHVMLQRTKKYNPAGRYQTEEEAKEIDVALKGILEELGVHTQRLFTDPSDLLQLLDGMGIRAEGEEEIIEKFTEIAHFDFDKYYDAEVAELYGMK